MIDYFSGTVLCLLDIPSHIRVKTCREDLFGFIHKTGLFIYEELVVHLISTFFLIDNLGNQHKNFRENSAYAENIKTQYNDLNSTYTTDLSKFVSSIRPPVPMKLETMLNN